MSQQISDKDEVLNEVNVIPLADLSLVLLIILMVMSPMISQALIQVTSAKAAQALTQEELPAEPETPLIVSYGPGALKINGTLMGSDIEFVTRLGDIVARRRDKSVILTASPDLAHGKVVRLMDLIKRHGAKDLMLVKWDVAAAAEAPVNPS
jgi:biopolymer transport protein ExbD